MPQRDGAHSAPLHATTERTGSAVIISAAGEVDASNEGTWEQLLSGLAATAIAPGPLVVDVRDVDFMGCCAFAVLARQADRCRRRGIKLCLVSRQPIIARTVAACGLRPLLPVHRTIAKALSPSGR